MEIVVNGQQQEIKESNINIFRLLSLNSVEAPEMVSVQLNGEIIDREHYESTLIADNDEVEFLYFMGGGA